ncbi:MAG: hypothetical protein EBT07_05710 [Actinobacteria bacterium]|nr:hypothetical protein [Actinomycetota bacterium]
MSVIVSVVALYGLVAGSLMNSRFINQFTFKVSLSFFPYRNKEITSTEQASNRRLISFTPPMNLIRSDVIRVPSDCGLAGRMVPLFLRVSFLAALNRVALTFVLPVLSFNNRMV